MEKGFSGAQDCRVFSESLSMNYIPSSDTITYLGIFNSHYFQIDQPAKSLVDVEAYCVAHTDPFDPCSSDAYLSLLLKSNLSGIGNRRPIDIVFVLDKSGSMDSPLGKSNDSCINLAKKAIIRLISVLNKDDYFSLIALDIQAHVIIPLTKVADIDLDDAKNKISAIYADNGTDLCKGYIEALNQISKSNSTNEKRILYSTDMNDLSENNFLSLVEDASNKAIYTTILGIGLHLNVNFLEKISKNKGFNYFSAFDDKDLNQIVVDDFKFNFFPIAHNIEVSFSSCDFKVMDCYGSDYLKPQEIIRDKNDDLSTWKSHNHKFDPYDLKSKVEFCMLYFRRSLNGRVKMPIIQRIATFLRNNKASVITVSSMFSSNKKLNSQNKQCTQGGLILLKLQKELHSLTSNKILLTVDYTANGHRERREIEVQIQGVSKKDQFELPTLMRQGMFLYISTKMKKILLEHKLNLVNSKEFKNLYNQVIMYLKKYQDVGSKEEEDAINARYKIGEIDKVIKLIKKNKN
jgi:uncharacterized protein YegL